MSVTLEQILARVAAGTDTEHRSELRRVVLETIAAVGLLVNTRTGEVYDPAPRQDIRPRDDRNFRFVGGRRHR